jgi:hypothetical protein
VETYPAAALAAWHIDCRWYKDRRDPIKAAGVRRQIVAEMLSIGSTFERLIRRDTDLRQVT